MARSVVIRSCFKKPLMLKLKGLRRASTNPFINFYLVYMENMYGCRCKVKGVSREAAKVWARMSHVEREPFIMMACQKRQRVKCCRKRSSRRRCKPRRKRSRCRKRSRKRSSRRRCKPRRKRSRRSRCRSRSRRRSGRSRCRSRSRRRSRSCRRGAKSLRRWCTAKPPCVGGSASRKRSRSRRSCSKRSRRRSCKRPRRRSRKCGSRRRRSRSRRRCSKRSTSQGSWCSVQPTCKRTETPPPGSGDPEDQ